MESDVLQEVKALQKFANLPLKYLAYDSKRATPLVSKR